MRTRLQKLRAACKYAARAARGHKKHKDHSILNKGIANGKRGAAFRFAPNRRVKHKATAVASGKIVKRLRPSPVIPKAPFAKLVREISQDMSGIHGLHWQHSAITELRGGAESRLTSVFKALAMVACVHNRNTVLERDMRTVLNVTNGMKPLPRVQVLDIDRGTCNMAERKNTARQPVVYYY